MLRTLGIDPGLDGGLALLSDDGLLVEVMPTRTLQNGKREVDAPELAKMVRAWKPDVAILELVGARPNQGVVSMFTFGQGLGTVKGVLGALGILYREPQPKAWQKVVFHYPLTINPKQNAAQSVRIEFPGHNFLASLRCKKPHGGMVDAALLALYGTRSAHWCAK